MVHDQRRDDPRRALIAYDRLHALDEVDPKPLECIDTLSTLLSDWPMLVRVLTKKAELIGSDEERAAVWRRVGEAKRDMLEDPTGSIQAYEKALELEPTNARTIDALIELYESNNDARRLVELYQSRVELSTDENLDLKYELLVQSADRYEQQLSDRASAIDAFAIGAGCPPGGPPRAAQARGALPRGDHVARPPRHAALGGERGRDDRRPRGPSPRDWQAARQRV